MKVGNIADERYVGLKGSRSDAVVDVPLDEIRRQTETLGAGEGEILLQVEVPNVLGMSEGQAIAALKALGFLVEIGEIYADWVAFLHVAEQRPGAGMMAPIGRTIFISLGPCELPEEGDGEGEDRHCCRCGNSKDRKPAEMFKRMPGDWLLIGLVFLALVGFRKHL